MRPPRRGLALDVACIVVIVLVPLWVLATAGGWY
jgi:hypothetical protein